MPELIAARGDINLILKNSGEPADDAESVAAPDQRALRRSGNEVVNGDSELLLRSDNPVHIDPSLLCG